jgi:L-arabinose isomerase
VWTSRPSLAVAAASWLAAGGPHHTVFTSAVDVETLDDFATIAGVEFATIDETTTVAGFRQALRWNAAWFHLKQGL